MLQFTLWVALEAEGLGANLQHYNPIVDEQVAAQWKLPSAVETQRTARIWRTRGRAQEKAFAPVEERLKVFGAQ